MTRLKPKRRSAAGGSACNHQDVGLRSAPPTRTALPEVQTGESTDPGIPPCELVLVKDAAGTAIQTFRRRISALSHVDVPCDAGVIGAGLRRKKWRLLGATIYRVQGGAMTLRRSHESGKRPRIDDVAFHLLEDGEARFRCDDRDVRILCGDIVVLDYARPLDIILTDFTCISFVYDRKLLPTYLMNLHGVRLTAEQASTKLLATHIRALVAAAPSLGPNIANAAAAAFLTTAAATFDAASPDKISSSAKLRDNAVAAIRRRLADPNLSPDLIASDINVSRSQLYRLFAERGGIAGLVVRLRLEGALRDMIQRPYTIRSIGDVALRHGFKSSAHFSRVFKRDIGRTPSDVLRDGMKRIKPLRCKD